MKGYKKGKLGTYLIMLPILALLVASCMLAGCKKKEAYRNIRIMDITGEAVVNRDGQEGLEAYVNMNLQSEDELITEKGAKVTLRLDDDKYVIVGEDSKLVLIAEGTAEDSMTRIELEYGAVFSDIKEKLSDKSGYEVVTPSSVMSVRGTQFEVVYREIKDEAGKLVEKIMKVLTFDGEVYVKPEGTNDKRISKAGTMEVLVERAEGQYEFDGGTKEIEAEDLSELSATYLKEDLSESDSDLTEEEKTWKEELLEKIEEFFEGGFAGKDETPGASDKDVYKWNNHTYRFVPLEGRTWEQINAYCKENGGHLATIMSAEENSYLYDLMAQGGFECAYFGYTDEAIEGEWKWVTGEAATYENWYEADVDNYREEDYAMLWAQRPYFWNDGGLRESSNVVFICEWDTDGQGNVLTPTPVPTSIPDPTGTPTPVPGQETENQDLTLEVYLPKVIKPLETYEVSGIEGLYEALKPNTRSIMSPDFEEKITLQEEMHVWLNYIADTYVQGEGEIKDAAEEVFGKEVVITCEGFYSESDDELLYPLDDHRTFGEFGVDDSYLTLYPVYTVHIPEDEVSYRYVPVRLMIEEEEDYNFYTFMVQAGTDLGLPKVEGYDMYWLTGSDKTGSPRQAVEENQLGWPILQAEKQNGEAVDETEVDETALFHGIYYHLKIVKNLEDFAVTDKKSFYDELEPCRNYLNQYNIWSANIASATDFCETNAETLEKKSAVVQSAEEYFGEAVEVTCTGFYDKDRNNYYEVGASVKITDVRGSVAKDEEIVFYPTYTVKVVSTGEEYDFSPVILQVKEGEEVREYAMMMERAQLVGLPQLTDGTLTWLNEAGEATGSEQELVDTALAWKYIGVNN